MALPKQIQKQIIDVKAIESDINAKSEIEGTVDKTQEEIDALLSEVESKEPEGKPPAEVTELHPQEEAPEPSEKKTERVDWKHKFAVLKGKYDAEVPRLNQDLRDANSRIEKIEAKMEAVVTPKEEAPKASALITPEETADYGEDLLDVIGRKAQEIVNAEYKPQLEGLNREISELKQQIGVADQRISHQEQNEVFAVLNREVKDWQSTNKNPDFHSWLDLLDPFSGITRKKLMLDAFDANNAPRVKAFFDSFLKENAAVTPNTTGEQPAVQAGTTSTLDLEDYIAPGTPKGGGQAGAPKEKRTWTNAEVGKFYGAVQKGHYKNRPEDKARIEADIVAATREGRITG